MNTQFCIAFRERLKRRVLRMLFVRGRLGSKKVARLPARRLIAAEYAPMQVSLHE
jgi:hypothetical protein